MSWSDPSIVVDPFTFGALIAIAVWLDRRLRTVEKTVAYNAGFLAGSENKKEVKR